MNLLITGAWQEAKEHIEKIRNMGHEVVFLQQEKEPLPCDYTWVEGVICNGLFLYRPYEKFENLKYVQLTSAGLDRLPAAKMEAEGVEIRNARGVYSVPMAEYALGGVLEIYKRFPQFRESQTRHAWEKRRDLQELSGKTVCILGCGSIGSECARRFTAFDCSVIGVATARRSQPFFEEVVALEDLDTVLPQADVVVVTIPLTETTRHLLDESRFARMKPGALLVNMARGAIVDTDALLAALKSGHLSGAVLDVFEEEPLGADSELWDLENVLITPHNSFVSDRVQQRMTQVIFENLTNKE